MSSLMDNALGQVLQTTRRLAGATITYRRGLTSVSLTAVPGETRVEAQDSGGAIIQARVRDWLIEAATLVLDDVLITPEPGDAIETASETYEVADLDGLPCWRWSDTAQTTIRVHTRRTQTGPATI